MVCLIICIKYSYGTNALPRLDPTIKYRTNTFESSSYFMHFFFSNLKVIVVRNKLSDASSILDLVH